MEKIRSFRDLRIWKKGIEIVKEVYAITNQLPKEELYGLSSQMRRAAVSIPSNIAEGFKRVHKKEFKQFLHITLGSAAELETHLVLVDELGYLGCEKLRNSLENLDHLSRMIRILLRKINA